jgi:ClpP class serine protease
MRNPATLAAELSGRPLLMLPSAVPQYARALGVATGEDRDARSPFASFVGRARRLFRASAEAEHEPLSAPLAVLPRWMGEPDSTGFGYVVKDRIAVIDVSGPLMAEGFGWGDCWYHGYDTLRMAYEEAQGDPRVSVIATRAYSPGGVAAPGLPELGRYLRDLRGQDGAKPHWAFCEAAYSAMYWIAAQADQVVAPREGGVGSIGAVITHCDMSGMLSQDGIVVTPIIFGAKKVDGSPVVPLSDTARADMQAEVDQCGRWFVADVVAGRPNLTEDAVLATQAGCFFGDSDQPALSGLAQGLTDQVLTEREAFAALRDLANAPISPAAKPQPAARTENDVKTSAVMAAMTAAGLSAAQIAAVAANLPADGDEEDKKEGPEEGDPNDDEDKKEKPEAGDPAKGPDDDPKSETAANAPDGATALAITGLPEAKGREALARKLAATPGMTAASAKELLAAAPKASAMTVADPDVKPQGGASGEASSQLAQGRQLAAQLKEIRGGKRA